MNKRYIDFVPVDKKGAKKAPARVVPKKTASKKAEPKELPMEEIFEEKPRPAGVSTGLEPKFGVIEDYRPKFVRTEVPKRPLAAKPVASSVEKKNVAPKKVVKPAMTRPVVTKSGSIVRPGAPKRPVANRSVAQPKLAVQKTAVQRSVAQPKLAVQKTAVQRSVAQPKPVAKKPVGPEGPRITKFLNTNKIEKRPLSRTVPKFVPPVPEPKFEDEPEKKSKKKKTPERIIAMPDKDSRAGMIIAVILTIILGAAAGTVAFLLLPK